uniref:Retrotransposon protein n=1 Tax=Cucumis melo TaxID=3656 RepID=A0A9I9CKY9_CUCME
MRGPACNRFRWNNEVKCIIVEKELFDNWFRRRVSLTNLFPIMTKLHMWSGGIGRGVALQTCSPDVGSNEPTEYEGFDMSGENDMEFPSMYNQEIDMFQDDVCTSQPTHASDDSSDRADPSERREASARVRLR